MKVITIILGTLSTASFFLFILKVIIHCYLDNNNGYAFKFSFLSGMGYFLPYNKKVNPEFNKTRKTCNYVLKLVFIFFGLSIALLLILY